MVARRRASATSRASSAVLAERNVASLDDLVADLAGRPSGRRVAVTFDDGYADFASVALPALRARAIPATLFVTTGALGADGEFWWDELERIVLAAPALPATLVVAIGETRVRWAFATDGDRRALYPALHRRVGRLAPPRRRGGAGCARTGPGVDARQSRRPIVRSRGGARGRSRAIARPSARTASAIRTSAALPTSTSSATRSTHSKARLEARHSAAPIEPLLLSARRPRAGDGRARAPQAGFRRRVRHGVRAPSTGGADVFDLPRVEVPNLDGPAFARWLDEWVG